MEILRIIHEIRNFNHEQVSTAKVFVQGGVSQEQIDALFASHEELSSYSELMEHSLTFRQPADQALVEVQERAEQLELEVGLLTQQATVLEGQKTQLLDEVSELSGRLSGLISPPIQGAAWDASKRYTRDDRVVEGENEYRCLRFNRGKQPSLSPEYWALVVEIPGLLVWAELASGTEITIDTRVTHNNKTWVCVKAHTKGIIRQPSAFSEYWSEETP